MKRTIAIFLFAVFVVNAWANGDPVAEFCALTLTKTPVSRHIPEVQIINEQIVFEPIDRYTHIHVTYTLQNNSDLSFNNIAYGFPVDWVGEGALHWKPDYYTESLSQKGWSDDYVRSFTIKLDGNKLKTSCSGDSLLRKGQSLGEERAKFRRMSQKQCDSLAYEDELLFWMLTTNSFDENEMYKEPVYRKWYYSHFSIPARATVTLEVDYTIQNNHTITLYQANSEFVKSTFNNNDEVLSTYNKFFYDFSPAAAWGNGKADKLSFRILPKDSVTVWGYELNDYQYSAENFDFLKANPLMFGYECNLPYTTDAENIVNHRLPAESYQIMVNGKDGDYKALCDNNLKTSLFLPADEQGMVTIEIKTFNPEFVTGLAIAHGDWRNAKAHLNSPRADSLMITCSYYNESCFFAKQSEKPDFTDKESLLLSMQRFNLLGRSEKSELGNSPYNPDDYMKSLIIRLHAPDGKGVTLSEIILTEDTEGWSDYMWRDKNEENVRVIREFYREYYEKGDKLETMDSVVAKYGSKELVNQLETVCDREFSIGMEADPFFNSQDPTGFSADEIKIETHGRGEYYISGSTIQDFVILKMNREHKIVRVLSEIYCY